MELVETLRDDRVLVVVRAARVADADGLAHALLEHDLRCVEITLTAANALAAISAATAAGAHVGVGTVLTAEQVREAVDAGARFVVTPAWSADVVETCHELDVPVLPGALTPSEVVRAWRAGAAVVKLFPAGLGGPRYLADLVAPLPDVPLLPSGGVGVENAAAFIAAGAIAVSAGSSVAAPELVTAGDHVEIARRACALRDAALGERCGEVA